MCIMYVERKLRKQKKRDRMGTKPMNNEIRDYLNKIVRGELEDISIRKKASAILEKYTMLALWNETNQEHIEQNFSVIKIQFNDDFENPELLLIKRFDAPKVKRFIQECYDEFYPENEEDETALDLQKKYTYVHNYIQSCLDNHSDIPHAWLTYEDVNLETFE